MLVESRFRITCLMHTIRYYKPIPTSSSYMYLGTIFFFYCNFHCTYRIKLCTTYKMSYKLCINFLYIECHCTDIIIIKGITYQYVICTALYYIQSLSIPTTSYPTYIARREEINDENTVATAKL